LNSSYSTKIYRWVLLRHIGAPDDLSGIHYDLLLEDNNFCRTWRLSDIPLLDGPYVGSVNIASHKLEWLDIKEKEVTGNRGVATRIKKGIFFNCLPSLEKSSIHLSLMWEEVEGNLLIDENGCRIYS
tara:strand:- start:75 stop:455 length:381 start_codon:yes stop_codon:yes gene_type:complete